MTFGLKFYFRKIDIVGVENIDPQKPIIFACNHPSSFMEAVLLACFQPRTLHFLVRGDVFRIKWLKGILHATNQIPIYRFRDGFSNLRQNKGTFSKAYDVLEKAGAIIIYPEGSTIWTKELRPLQKGAAKLALGALNERGLTDLQIIPVGVNYFNVFQWRSEVSIQIGLPIEVSSFTSTYQTHPNRGYRALTEDLHEAMKPLVLSIPDYEKSADPFLSHAIRTGKHVGRNQWFENQREWAEKMDISKMEFLSEQSVGLLTRSEHMYWTRNNTKSLGWMIVSFLPALLGAVIVEPIRLVTGLIIRRNNLDIEFIAPVKVAVFLALMLVVVVIGTSIALFQSRWMGVFFFLSLPLWAYCYAFFTSNLHDYLGYLRRDKVAKKMEHNLSLFS